MTMQSVIGGAILPHLRPAAVAQAFQTFTVDANGEKLAFVIPCTKTGNFKKIRFYVNVLTTSGDLDVRIETIDLTTGDPTGTLVNANLTATVTVSAVGEVEAVFTTAAQVTIGTVIAIVMQRTTGTFAGSIAANATWGTGNTVLAFGYTDQFLVAWLKDDLAPNICIEYDDATRMVSPFFLYMSAAVTTDTWNDTTAGGDRIGMRFKVPFKARLSGVGMNIDNDGDMEVLVYDTDGATIIASTTVLDAQARESAAVHPLTFIPFTSPPTLTPGSFYRVVIHPTTATSCVMTSHNVVTAADLDCAAGGQDFHYTKNGTASAPTQESDWTQTLTRQPPMWLFFDQLSDDAGGGGGSAADSRYYVNRGPWPGAPYS
jgi:hypothetical protein